jgi:hypothetical protein
MSQTVWLATAPAGPDDECAEQRRFDADGDVDVRLIR